MASELRVNTLKDASGNNSIATSFVAGGSAKAWINQTTNTTINDSLNVSSITDNAAGDFSFAYSNAFANAFYSQGGHSSSGSNYCNILIKHSVVTTTANRIRIGNAAGTAGSSTQLTLFDSSNVPTTVYGDLA
jgi:hypothetical protein